MLKWAPFTSFLTSVEHKQKTNIWKILFSSMSVHRKFGANGNLQAKNLSSSYQKELKHRLGRSVKLLFFYFSRVLVKELFDSFTFLFAYSQNFCMSILFLCLNFLVFKCYFILYWKWKWFGALWLYIPPPSVSTSCFVWIWTLITASTSCSTTVVLLIFHVKLRHEGVVMAATCVEYCLMGSQF
jgi:hypothetical protein